jgi:hypothetical protein
MAPYTITVLKAPWPSGAKVGDVIELDTVPAWAAGTCEPAAEGAEATVAFPAPEQPEGEPAAEGAAPKGKRKS